MVRSDVFSLGNPAVWWASIQALVYCGIYAVRRRRYAPALIVIAFLAAWLPFSRVSRVLFLYHMFGSLPFMILALSFALEQLRHAHFQLHLGSAALPALEGRHLAIAWIMLVVVVFVSYQSAMRTSVRGGRVTRSQSRHAADRLAGPGDGGG